MSSTTISPPSSTEGDGGGPKSTGIAKGAILMGVAVLLSRVLGQVRDSIIAAEFGRNWQTDAYQAAFTIPDLLFFLLQSGALSSSLVPILAEFRQQGKDKSADKTLSVVATMIVLVIGTLIVFMEFGAEWLTLKLNPGFEPRAVALAAHLTRILLPAQICFFLGGLLMAVLYSRKQFLIPSLGPVVYNAGIIFGGVVLSHIGFGISGLVWGAVGGAIIGNLLMPLLAVRKVGVKFKPSLEVRHPGAMKFWRMIAAMGLGVALPQVDQIVNKYFSSLGAAGDTTAMMNAYRLMLLPIGVLAQSTAIALLPVLSEQASARDFKGMRGTVNSSLRNILFMTVPATGLMFLLAEPVIGLLFQWKHFTAADTALTAIPLRYLSLGIFVWSCQSLLTRGFYALQEPSVPLRVGSASTVLFVLMDWLAVKAGLGNKGIALATTLAVVVNTIVLLLMLTKRIQGIEMARLMNSLVRIVLATAGLCAMTWACRDAIGWLAENAIAMTPKVEVVLQIGVAGLMGLYTYYNLARLLRIPELTDATASIAPKLKPVLRLLGKVK